MNIGHHFSYLTWHGHAQATSVRLKPNVSQEGSVKQTNKHLIPLDDEPQSSESLEVPSRPITVRISLFDSLTVERGFSVSVRT